MDLFKEVVFAADAATVAVLMTTSKSMQQAISGLHMWAYYVSRLETHFPMANMLKEILEIGEATPDLTCPVYPHQPAKDTEWFKKHDPRFVDAQGWEALEPWKKFGRLYTFASQMIRNFMAFLDDQLYNRGMFMPLLGEDPEAFRWCWFEGSDEAEFGKFRSHLDRMAVMEQSSPKRFQLCMSLISIMQAIDDHRSGDIFHFSEAFAGVAFDPDTGSSYGERFFQCFQLDYCDWQEYGTDAWCDRQFRHPLPKGRLPGGWQYINDFLGGPLYRDYSLVENVLHHLPRLLNQMPLNPPLNMCK